jgi:NDP-sugar pyrophosphorylase family protein
MKAIILAAGRASRLGSITENTPKCLLPVGNKTILDWQLD